MISPTHKPRFPTGCPPTCWRGEGWGFTQQLFVPDGNEYQIRSKHIKYHWKNKNFILKACAAVLERITINNKVHDLKGVGVEVTETEVILNNKATFHFLEKPIYFCCF